MEIYREDLEANWSLLCKGEQFFRIDPQQLTQIMQRLIGEISGVFGESIQEVILFGSYARHEADDDSDIDVMLLIDLPREDLPDYRRHVAEIAADLLYEYGVVVSPLLERKAFFERNRATYPLYRTIAEEGISYVA